MEEINNQTLNQYLTATWKAHYKYFHSHATLKNLPQKDTYVKTIAYWSKKNYKKMFKKIEIWVLYLTILISVVFAIGFGVLVRQELVGSIKAGWVSKAALFLAEMPVNIKKVIRSPSVDLTLEDRFPAIDGFEGTPNSKESFLLLSRYDGDLQEGVVELVDLTNFEVIHTWNPDIDAFNDLVQPIDEFK